MFLDQNHLLMKPLLGSMTTIFFITREEQNHLSPWAGKPKVMDTCSRVPEEQSRD